MMCMSKVLNCLYNFSFDIPTLNHLFVPEIKNQTILVFNQQDTIGKGPQQEVFTILTVSICSTERDQKLV